MALSKQRTCGCECDIHSIDRAFEFKTTYSGGEEPFVVLMPGRRSGAATIGHRRIDTEMVADFYWSGGVDDLIDGYDLTMAEIVVSVWYEARYGSRTRRKRWKDWLEANEAKLWSPDFYGTPELPPTNEIAEVSDSE
jgi:uncharacterized protein (DUF433 family)